LNIKILKTLKIKEITTLNLKIKNFHEDMKINKLQKLICLTTNGVGMCDLESWVC